MTHTSYSPWSLQPDGWDPGLVETAQPSFYASWPRENVFLPARYCWQHSQGSSFFTRPQQHRDFLESPHHHPYNHGHVKGSLDHVRSDNSAPHEPSSSTLASPIAAGQKAHIPKRPVKSACTNCKKIHSRCDVKRPCTRCTETNKTESCFDVAQRRKGRPRSLQNSLSKSGRLAIAEPRNAKPLIAAQQHGQYPVQPLVYHHGYPMSIDPYNVYPSVPMVYLGIIGTEFRIMQPNQAFRGFFEFQGDLRGRRLDQIVDRSDHNRLQQLCFAMRDAIEKEMLTNVAPLWCVDQDDINKLPDIDSVDHFKHSKTVLTKRELLWFRFPNVMKQFEIDFLLSKTDVLFITLVLHAIRAAPVVLRSSQQTQQAIVSPGVSSYNQETSDLSRFPHVRQFARTSLLPLPSPDHASPTSSYKLGSATSAWPASTLHLSAISHLPHGNHMLSASVSNQHVAPGQMKQCQKYLVVNSNLSPSQSTSSTLPAASTSYGQPGPPQDLRDLLNASRKLPLMPGVVGSPDSQTSDNAYLQILHTQQNYWQGKGPEYSAKGDNKATGQVESPSTRSRMDVRGLIS